MPKSSACLDVLSAILHVGRAVARGASHDAKVTLGRDGVFPVRPNEAISSHHHPRRHPSCYHYHLQHDQPTTSTVSIFCLC
jgi:hypothetical protein